MVEGTLTRWNVWDTIQSKIKGAICMRRMLGGAALALFGVALGFSFATKTDVLAEAKWWDLMTAFGTVGAAIVALGTAGLSVWLAGEEKRFRHEDQLARAKVISAKLRVRVAVLATDVKLIIDDLHARSAGQYDSANLRYGGLPDAVVDLTLDVTSSELEGLVPLPDRCAERLAEVLELLRSINKTADLIDRAKGHPQLTDAAEASFLLLRELIAAVDQNLNAALLSLKRTSPPAVVISNPRLNSRY